MSTYVRLQISGSGAFDEPYNGIDVYPTELPLGGNPRTSVIKIPGKKGGVIQIGGLDNEKYFLRAVALGDETVRESKETGLENLSWHTGTLNYRGRPISMSVAYRNGEHNFPYNVKESSNSGFETWSDPNTPASWMTRSMEEFDPDNYITQSDDPYEGAYCVELYSDFQYGCIIHQDTAVIDGNTYTMSAMLRTTGSGKYYIHDVFWLEDWTTESTPGDYLEYEELYSGSVSNQNWHTAGPYTVTAPVGARYAKNRFTVYAVPGANCQLWVDAVTFSGDDGILGKTTSNMVAIQNYNVQTRRGTSNVHDVRVNLIEWTD